MIEKENLPKGWTIAKFEDLLDYIQPTNYIVKSTEYKDTYKTPVLTAGKSFIKGYTNETDGIFNQLPTIIFDDFTTATQFVNFPFKVKSSAMKILQPTCDLVNIKLVYYLMQIQNIKGETHKRFWISEYSQLPVPLAPLNEKKRILDKIEELITDLDKGIEYLETTKQQLRVYRQAVLRWAFEGKLSEEWRKNNPNNITSKDFVEDISKIRENNFKQSLELWKSTKNKQDLKITKPQKPSNINPINFLNKELLSKSVLPKEWEIVPLVFVSDNEPNSIVDGPFGSSINVKEDYIDSGVPVIRMVNIRPLLFVKEQMKYIKVSKFQELKRHNILSGDILIAKVGATIGDCCIYPLNEPEGMLSTTGSCRVRVDKTVINPKFLEYYMSYNKHTLQRIASQTAQPFLNMDVVKSYPVVLPLLHEQVIIIKELESKLTVCNKIEETIESSLLQAEALRLSIIKKAFEGKLVSQNPSDEHAEKLLERIRAAKGKEKPEKKVKAEKKVKTKSKKVAVSES
jgi:type I restriction enzyme S subunit